MGFLVSQHGELGAIPPPPFLSVSPLESMRSGGAIPPLKRGISAILARYPMKTRQMGAIPPSCDTISKRYCAIWGGISHWAAKQRDESENDCPWLFPGGSIIDSSCIWEIQRGLSKRGLGPKGNWAKKAPFGATSALPPWLWSAEELVPISPEKARFSVLISPQFSLKIWGLVCEPPFRSSKIKRHKAS